MTVHRGVVPAAKNEPLAGLLTTVGLGSRLSVAVTVKLTFAPVALVVTTAIVAGRFSTGAIESPPRAAAVGHRATQIRARSTKSGLHHKHAAAETAGGRLSDRAAQCQHPVARRAARRRSHSSSRNSFVPGEKSRRLLKTAQ